MNRRTLPVLTRKRIPGRAPWLAGWLRAVAERIEALADRFDDRYERPSPEITWADLPTTITFGDYSADDERTERHDA